MILTFSRKRILSIFLSDFSQRSVNNNAEKYLRDMGVKERHRCEKSELLQTDLPYISIPFNIFPCKHSFYCSNEICGFSLVTICKNPSVFVLTSSTLFSPLPLFTLEITYRSHRARSG